MLRRAIHDELHWDPAIDSSRIRVTVNDGIAILSGAVRTYAEKCRAESIVRRICGVIGVRNEIEVRVTIGDYRTDATLARVVNDVFDALARMPEERPRASVTGGWVTLEGAVPWAFQKRLAEEAIRDVAGVRGITNRIAVVPREAAPKDLDAVLMNAARRRSLAGDGLQILTDDGRVTLRGTVRSCAEHDELLELAWCAAGVHAVDDQITVV